MIVTMDPADAVTTSRLHRAQLTLGFFPRLGERFLRRYHATFIDSPYGVALVARDPAGTVVGFLVGTVDNGEHYRWVVRNRGLGLAVSGIAAMLVRPRLLMTFARTRLPRYVRGLTAHLRPTRATGSTARATSDTTSTGPPIGVLTHVAMDEGRRGNGVGRQLVEAHVEEARRRGALELRLLTVEGGARAFYDRLGWERFRERQGRDGARVHEFRLVLHEIPQRGGA